MNDDENIENDDEMDLFRKEMAQVKPIKSDNRVTHKPKRKIKRASYQSASIENTQHEIIDNFSDSPIEDCPDVLKFSKTGLQQSLLKKLRLGKLPIESELDLHGMTVAEARQALLYFIAECNDLGIRNAIVVHGKGYSSPNNKPIIKAYVNRWLRESETVLAFHSAQKKDGGTGAVYVLLKNCA